MIALWWMFTFRFRQYGSWDSLAARLPLMQDPGSAVSFPAVEIGLRGFALARWLMPPESVPVLLYTRLFAICRLCAQPWTKMPPPPWELFVMPRPSMLRRVALEIAGERVGRIRATGAAVVGRQQRRASRE